MTFVSFSSLRQEQPQRSNISTELGYLADPQMGDAVDPKVKRKRKMIPALGVAWKDGSGRLLIAYSLHCVKMHNCLWSERPRPSSLS
jgi:hypothetical protein